MLVLFGFEGGGYVEQIKVFDYGKVFLWNIGWVIEVEQEKFWNVWIVVVGLGGVGGVYLLILVWFGMSKFNIVDFDEFGLYNFNW